MLDALKQLDRKKSIPSKLYVQLMIDVIARGLVAASHNDEEIASEIAGFEKGRTIKMLVMPSVAQFCLQVTDDYKFKRITLAADEKADLTIKFKHLSLAFLVFTFQESTAKAFARDRMVADGDICDAIRMVRCLNRLEVLILPKMVAELAVKQYPAELTLHEKLTTASKVYAGVASSVLPDLAKLKGMALQR